ncbi:MAG: hypothetical protein ABIF10_01185 [Candidatus Woesearchaeota archaeon]
MNELLINICIILFVIVAYLLFRKRKTDPEFQKLYYEILNSDKYKVKDQYDRLP